MLKDTLKQIEEDKLKILKDKYDDETLPVSAYSEVIINDIKYLIKSSNDKILSAVEEEIDKEQSRWNGDGEYYSNVSEALDNLKNNIRR